MADFEKETLADFLQAMSSQKLERDYQAEWLDGTTIDFYFPESKIAVCYLNGRSRKSAANPKALEQLKKRGVVLHIFTIADVCKQAILDKLPSICDKAKISENNEKIYSIMSRFIKTIMREIQADDPDFSEWAESADELDMAQDMTQEKRELEMETQADIINAGEETDVAENPSPEYEQPEIYEAEAPA